MENKQIELMGKAPIHKAILKLSLPVVIGMMVQVLYNLVDTFFIGMLQDPNQLAAASITTPYKAADPCAGRVARCVPLRV